MKYRTLLFVLLVFMVFSFWGLSENVATSSPQQGGTLTIAITSETNAFDPHFATGYYGEIAMSFTHERLVKFDEDGNVNPLLAESWEIIDELTWEFTIRDNVKFHDGSKLTADVVAWYFNFSLEPANATAWRSEIAPIIDKVEAVDDLKVRFHLKNPHAPLLVMLGSWPVGAGIKSKEAWDDYGKDTSLRTPVGTGPFMLEEWRRGDRYIFVRNPNYWQEGLPYLDRVVVRIIPEPSTQVAALLRNEVNIIDAVPRHEIQRLQREGIQIISASGWQQEILWMNNQKPPFDDHRVRLAIAKAINKEQIINTIFFGTAIEAIGGIPSWHWAYKEGLETSSYDVEKAKELLQAAGYGDGFRTSIITSTRQPELKIIAEFIQQQLRALNIDVSVQVMELGAWWDLVLAEPYQYEMLLGEYSLTPDPHDFLWLNLRSDNIYALSRPQYEEIDRLLDIGRSAVEIEDRVGAYHRIQEIVDEEVPLVFLLHRNVLRAASPGVINFWISGNGYIYATEIWLE